MVYFGFVIYRIVLVVVLLLDWGLGKGLSIEDRGLFRMLFVIIKLRK